MGNKTCIIAECGVNHNADQEIARKLIESAAKAGADYAKFQTFKIKYLPKKTQKLLNPGFELTLSDHYFLKYVCEDNGIKLLSSPFDEESIELLHKLDLPLVKIPSSKIYDEEYLENIAGYDWDVILSSGMATEIKVRVAIQHLRYCRTLYLLQCTSAYPAPYKEVNLNVLKRWLQEYFWVEGVGLSDHTLGIEVPIAAVAMGATIIEKHITLDRSMKGPDHKASLEPDEFKKMVQSIRNIELAMGDGKKVPMPSERKYIKMFKK